MANAPKPQQVTTPAPIHPNLTTENISVAESVILAIFAVVQTGKAFQSPADAELIFGLIDRLRSGLAVSAQDFDKTLSMLRLTNGDDFLPNVVHFRKPREDKAEKSVDIFSARAKRK
jgi:hypothetical protein